MTKTLLVVISIIFATGCATNHKRVEIAPVDSEESESIRKPVSVYNLGPLTLAEKCYPFTKESAQETFDLFFMICSDICLSDNKCAPYTHQLCLQKVHEFEDETQIKYYQCMSEGIED